MTRAEIFLKIFITLALAGGLLLLGFYFGGKLVPEKYRGALNPMTQDYLNSYGDLNSSDPKMIGNSLAETASSSSQRIIDNPPLALKGFSETIPILMYHYIEPPTATTTLKGLYIDPIIFDKQLEALKKDNYQTLFISELATNLESEKKLTGKNIVLSFDDGYEDFYTQAWPILKKYNYKATLYIIINRLDTKGYLTRAQVKELAASDLVEIGSHTFNHPDLRSLKKKDANFEIQASKKILETISGRPVLTFAYPFGYYRTDFFDMVSSIGYKAAVLVTPGVKQGKENIWLLRRLRPGERTGEVFRKWLEEWERANY